VTVGGGWFLVWRRVVWKENVLRSFKIAQGRNAHAQVSLIRRRGGAQRRKALISFKEDRILPTSLAEAGDSTNCPDLVNLE
jgi:hypothetical protein